MQHLIGLSTKSRLYSSLSKGFKLGHIFFEMQSLSAEIFCLGFRCILGLLFERVEMPTPHKDTES